LRVKLCHLAEWNQKRQRAAGLYQEMFSSAEGVMVPYEPTWSRAVYHLYVIRVRERQDLQARLTAAGIGTGIHYPIPLHLQKAYAGFGYGVGDFPVTELVAAEILSLPMYPTLKRAEQERVAQNVLQYLAEKESPERCSHQASSCVSLS
jgi:dTDP-4-amino-4,6-dideoxygalactose transaminase